MSEQPLRAVLVSLRNTDDPMAEQELRCFAQTAGVPAITKVHACEGLDEAALLDADVLFFGGSGAYSVLDDEPWVKATLDFFVNVAHRGVPAWASCFGYQGLALALGGTVNADPNRQRLGAYRIETTEQAGDDPLLGAMPASFYAQLGHHDHVDVLPEGVTLLATSEGGKPEAFRVDGTNFWGAQFHPELSKNTTYERWVHYRAYYEGDQRDEIDAFMRGGPETPAPHTILRRLVDLARSRRS